MTVENNPIEKNSRLAHTLKDKFPSLANLNLQKIQNLLEEQKEKKKEEPPIVASEPSQPPA